MIIPLFNQWYPIHRSHRSEWLGLLRQSGESVGGLSDAGPVVGRSMRTQQKQQKTPDFSSFSWGKIEKKGLRKSAFIAFFCVGRRSIRIICVIVHRRFDAVLLVLQVQSATGGASGGSSWQRKIENKDKSMMKFAMIPSWISHTQEKTHGIQTMFIHFGTKTTCHLPAFGFIIGPMEHMECEKSPVWPLWVSPDDVPRDSCDASCRSSNEIAGRWCQVVSAPRDGCCTGLVIRWIQIDGM